MFWHSEQFLYTTCTELVFCMYWTRNSMKNLSSYFGLIDAWINASGHSFASGKDLLPVTWVQTHKRVHLLTTLKRSLHITPYDYCFLIDGQNWKMVLQFRLKEFDIIKSTFKISYLLVKYRSQYHLDIKNSLQIAKCCRWNWREILWCEN